MILRPWLQPRRAAPGFLAGVFLWWAFPGAAAGYNDKSEKTSAVLFSPAGGVSVSNVTVSLRAESRAAAIRYTLDGSEPGQGSPLYSTPLLLTNTTVVRALAFPKDAEPGPLGAEVYTLLDDDLTN